MPNPLLVTLDDPDGLAAALRSDVAPLVFDLGDAEDPGDRLARRGAALSALEQHRRGRTETRSTATPDASPLPEGEGKRAGLPRDWRRGIVRVASLASGLVDGDLDAVMAGLPDAVLLSAVAGARDLQHLAAKLAVREAEHGLPAGHTGIIAMPADTAAGVLALASVPGATLRLRALALGSGRAGGRARRRRRCRPRCAPRATCCSSPRRRRACRRSISASPRPTSRPPVSGRDATASRDALPAAWRRSTSSPRLSRGARPEPRRASVVLTLTKPDPAFSC